MEGEACTDKDSETGKLRWWQLSLLGVACTIGTGFFLGSSLGIIRSGPSILLGFVLAALGTYFVFDALAKMTVADPLKGSFRSYAKKAYGRWAGFSSGWVYWCSELLIMGSQLTALSIFSRFWFPDIPMWVFAALYAVLGLGVIMTGTKGFESLENGFAVIKISAIVMFLLIAAAALLGLIDGDGHRPRLPANWFPAGAVGLWGGLLYAFYAFGGIEIMGLMALRLRRPKDAPKAGKIMLLLLAVIYVASIGLALTMVHWTAFVPKESPFVIALTHYRLPYVPHVMNAVMMIAGFSTMVASLFAVTGMLVTLAQDRDAPPFFAKKWRRKLAVPAMGLTAAGLVASIVLSLLLPERIYVYVTTAAGLMLLYNWLFILITSGRVLRLKLWGNVRRIVGMTLILFAVSGTVLDRTSRIGFMVSLLFVAVIGTVTLIMTRVWKSGESGGGLKKEQFVSFQSEIKPEPNQG